MWKGLCVKCWSTGSWYFHRAFCPSNAVYEETLGAVGCLKNLSAYKCPVYWNSHVPGIPGHASLVSHPRCCQDHITLFRESQVWWFMPVIPVFMKQQQADDCKFEASLGSTEDSFSKNKPKQQVNKEFLNDLEPWKLGWILTDRKGLARAWMNN